MQVLPGSDCMLAKNKQEFFRTKEEAYSRHLELYWDYGIELEKPTHDAGFNCWILEWLSPKEKIQGFTTDKEGTNTPNALGSE